MSVRVPAVVIRSLPFHNDARCVTQHGVAARLDRSDPAHLFARRTLVQLLCSGHDREALVVLRSVEQIAQTDSLGGQALDRDVLGGRVTAVPQLDV